MTVVGVFDSGHFEYDSALVLMHVADAARLYRLEGPTGIRLKLRDLHQARAVAVQRHSVGSVGLQLHAMRARSGHGIYQRQCRF